MAKINKMYRSSLCPHMEVTLSHLQLPLKLATRGCATHAVHSSEYENTPTRVCACVCVC